MIIITIVIYQALDTSGVITRQFARNQQITNRLRQVENAISTIDAAPLLDKIHGGFYVAGGYAGINAINPDSLLFDLPEYRPQVNKLNGLIKRKYSTDTLLTMLKISNLGDSIKQVINDIYTAENARINAAGNKEASDNKGIFLLLCTGVILCLILLVIFYQLINKNHKLREKTKADLVEAKNMAEQANKAKSTFLATMSQEIRTPLHDIISTAALLSETTLNEEQEKYAGYIQVSSVALLAVVNDIIDFSNIENSKIPLESSAFVLRDCLDEVVAVAGANNTVNKINYRIDGSLPGMIECDAVRLRQVLLTITDSLLKNSTEGHVDCNIRLVTEVNKQLEIEFTINNPYVLTDSSNGSEEALFGISSTRFSIAGRLVSQMGGNVKVTTEAGKGGTITFTIKAMRVDEKSSEQFFNRRKPIKWLDGEGDGKKISLSILVVDDHEVNQALLVQILTKLGHTCKTARNGVEAAGCAVEEKFDAIFMDIAMPVMDGIEATKRIREYYVHTDTPLIIGVTANALFTEKQKGFDAGMNDFLIKPYKPIDIKNMLDKWTALVFKLKYEL